MLGYKQIWISALLFTMFTGVVVAQTETTALPATPATTATSPSAPSTLLNRQTPSGDIQVQEQVVNGERVVKVTVNDKDGIREFFHSSENQDFEVQIPINVDGFNPPKVPSARTNQSLPGNQQGPNTGGAASDVPPADYDFYMTLDLPKRPEKKKEPEKLNIDPKELQVEEEALSALYLLKARQSYYKKDYKTALQHILKSIEIAPNAARNYEMLGSVYYRLQWEDLAIKNWRKSLRLNPKNQKLTVFLAKIDG